MSSRVTISYKNGSNFFFFEQLEHSTALDSFSCFIDEYNNYLYEDALRSQNDHVALTWLLRERDSNTIISYMISKAAGLARICNRQLFAARFLTVDADIEHNEGVLAFYEKNGFIPNAELVKKNSKTISMRKDIYQ